MTFSANHKWDGYVIDRISVPQFVDPSTILSRERFASHKNRVMGGLFLHQTRKTKSNSCNNRFSHLHFDCQVAAIYRRSSSSVGEELLERFFVERSNKTHPFGTDPVFSKMTSVYSSEMFQKEEEYYNISDASEMSATGTPFAFHPISIPGFKNGFPVIATTSLTRYRAIDLIEYLKAGHFLDGQTEDMVMGILAYNPDAKALGVGKTAFRWSKDGSVMGKTSVNALPGVYPTGASGTSANLGVIVDTLLPLACLGGLYAIWVTATLGKKNGETLL